jgi:regulatory protein
MRTVAELKRLMRTKVEAGEAGENKMDAVLLRLKEYRYLDDAVFASTYARLRQENEGFGKLRVQRDLMRKGVARDVIAHAIDGAYKETSEEAVARSYLERKRIPRPQDRKETARVIRRLSAAGFSIATILKVLKNWEINFDEEDIAGIAEPEN